MSGARYAGPIGGTLLLISTLAAPAGGATQNIMLTGYWPPTNEAVRQFSTNPLQNPLGWQGENWEGRGYDVYSFFPEFPDFPTDRKGVGDFEVDYQDTSADWWRITDEIRPVAIMTFSAGDNGLWELETQQRNLRVWQRDYVPPLQPTPRPPDGSVPVGHVRYSSLPTQAIADAVDAADLGITGLVDTVGFGGGFLSEFIAYHGVWYQELHSAPDDPFRAVAAGHIHVGPDIDWPQAQRAAEISLRVLIDHLEQILVPEPHGWILAAAAGTLVPLFRSRRRRIPRAPEGGPRTGHSP